MPLLLLLVAAAPVLIGLTIATRPVTASRSAAFAQRRGLGLTPANQPYLVAYLSHVRRWRTAGAVGGYLVGLASALPQERIAVHFLPLLTGWFAGAVVAEFRFPSRPQATAGAEQPVGAPVPGWLPLVPHTVAAATVGVTALVLALGRAGDQSGRVLAWGAGALACAALAATANRRVSNRTASDADVIAAGRAVAAHAVGAITAVGSALAIGYLVRQLLVVHDRFFDAAATAVDGIALLWTCGALVIAWLIATATFRGTSAAATPDPRSPRPVLAVVAILIAVSAGWAGYARWTDHPPYPAAAVHATATLRLTDHGHFEQDTRALGITGLNGLVDRANEQQFVGRVDYTTPAGTDADGTYHVIVIDKRLNRVAPRLYDTDGGGWGSSQSRLAARYPWLSATAPIISDAGYSSPGSSVSQAAALPGPMTFAGSVPDAPQMSLSDLMVVLVFTGPDQQTYWATRVFG